MENQIFENENQNQNESLGNLSFAEKLTEVFSRFAHFISRHKIITIVLAVLVVLISTVVVVGNHYLSKINYVPAENATNTYQSAETRTLLTLSTGETIDVSGLIKNSDGTYTLSDGRRIDSDGTIWNLDGSIVFYDGSYLRSDGIAVLSDGTTIYTDSTVVFQDGDCIRNTKITVDKEGYASFPSGEKSHITAFTISKDGKVVAKPTSLVSPKYSADGEWNVEDQEALALEQAKKDPTLKDAIEENDKKIERNFNDSKIWFNENVKNIMLFGVDNGSKTYPYGRSDAMILISVNQKTKKVNMISLSRAAYVKIKGYSNTRLSHAHGYGGPALAIDTIERNYKIRIDNYVSTNFSTFVKAIDAIGGITIKLTKKEAVALKSKIKQNGLEYKGEGSYKLNGTLALEYVRLRKIDTDRARTQRQRNVLVAIANKMVNLSVLELNNMLNAVLPYITTDLKKSEILGQLRYVPSYLSGTVSQYVIPYKHTSLSLRDGFEVLLLDWESEVQYLHDIVYAGETPLYMEK
ncbi:MAG: LCP family protein [Clostridia bacterium]|nr:LCP family protein [Clostridia bacterium]